MENIRNYKTNSKTKFVYFCHYQNQDEEYADNQEAYKQGNKVDTQKIFVGIFIDGRRNQVNDHCKKPEKIAGCPADFFF